jgi:hypothetical protein
MKMYYTRFAAILIFIFSGITLLAQAQKAPQRFKYRIAIIGNPDVPDTRWDDSQLQALKKLNFNTIQLNIAWGARPADEPLNLEDILTTPATVNDKRITERLNEMKRRARLAKKYGFRVLFHFGAPRIEHLYQKIDHLDVIDKETDVNSIQRPEIIKKYAALITRLAKEIPEIDDIQVYTYDQEAWLGNEFGYGIDRGVPLDERLPQFLQALTDAWSKAKPNGRLWWEPWELSAGEIYACIPHLPVHNFGMFMHVNIAEAQITKPVDVWFKNTARMAGERGIPVVGEGFFSGATEEVEPLQNIADTRLVYEELKALASVPELVGVKEYYGLSPDKFDPNQLLTGIVFNNPAISYNDAIKKIAVQFNNAQLTITKAWDLESDGMQLFPWDLTWNIRKFPQNKQVTVYHRWDTAHINGYVAISPSWRSNRRAMFITTENQELDPWVFEDAEKRSQAAADNFLSAINYYKISVPLSPVSLQNYLKSSINDLGIMEQSTRALECYCREANLVYLMRPYADKRETIPADMIQRFRKIMQLDIENQQKGFTENKLNSPTAANMLAQFDADPAKWVQQHLITFKNNQ